MTIDGLNEVKLRAIEMAISILQNENEGMSLLNENDKKDIFTLADKIYNYISMP